MTTNNAAAGAASKSAEGLRVSDSEREQIVRTLRDNYESGRIGYDEFNRRIDAAYHATYAHQLGALAADLPRNQPSRAVAPTAPAQPQRKMSGWQIAAIVGLVIFALAGLSWLVGTVTAHPVLTVIGVGVIVFILVKRNRRTRT